MVLITGGAGYIGSHTNKLFGDLGIETLVLDNLVYGHRQSVLNGIFVQGDIGNQELLNKIFSEYKIDTVIHFAAFAYVGESVKSPSKYYNNNVINTIKLLDTMNKFGVKNFIFSSTCATYGIPKVLPITEDEIQNPINPYGASKLMIERIIKDYALAYGLKYCVFRYFNAAGADHSSLIGEWHVPETHLIPIILDVAIGKRDTVNIFGGDYPTKDGTCIRDYIHVTDLADAHYRAYEYLRNNGESVFLNLGCKQGFSIKEIINTVECITGCKLITNITNRRPGDPPVLIGSADRAKEILGWVPLHSDMKNIINDAWNWHKKMNLSLLKV